MQTLSVLSWIVPGLALALAASCARKPEGLLAYVPPHAQAVAYVNLDQVRGTAAAARLPIPEDLRDASALLVAFDGTNWGTAVQRVSGITATGLTAGAGNPQLVRRAPSDAPAWLVASGSVTLPLPGNLANANRLIHQAQWIVAALRGDTIEATAECRSPEAAQHLEQNIRALATLARRNGLEVSSSGNSVQVRARVP
jgi:hypothetical protein